MNHIENFHLYQIVTDAAQAHDFLIAKNPELSPEQRFDLLKTMLEVTGQRASADAISLVLSNGLSNAGTTIAHGLEALGSSNIQAAELVQSAIANVVCAMSQSGPDGDVERGLVYLADSISSGLSSIDDALTRHANKK